MLRGPKVHDMACGFGIGSGDTVHLSFQREFLLFILTFVVFAFFVVFIKPANGVRLPGLEGVVGAGAA